MSTSEMAAYLVVPNRKAGGRSEDLRMLIEAVSGRPDIQLEVTGARAQPALLRLLATRDAIAELRARFGHRLYIEPDHALRW
jgi:hypothetical protein